MILLYGIRISAVDYYCVLSQSTCLIDRIARAIPRVALQSHDKNGKDGALTVNWRSHSTRGRLSERADWDKVQYLESPKVVNRKKLCLK